MLPQHDDENKKNRQIQFLNQSDFETNYNPKMEIIDVYQRAGLCTVQILLRIAKFAIHVYNGVFGAYEEDLIDYSSSDGINDCM